jgi:hypothetical protein
MVFKDCFCFNRNEYRTRIASYSDEALCKQEVVKIRQLGSGVVGAIGGFGLAFVTGGVTLVGTAVGSRRAHVADRELEIIREERWRWKLEFHQETTRDTLIPLVTGIFTMGAGLGCGLESGVAAMAPYTRV